MSIFDKEVEIELDKQIIHRELERFIFCHCCGPGYYDLIYNKQIHTVFTSMVSIIYINNEPYIRALDNNVIIKNYCEESLPDYVKFFPKGLSIYVSNNVYGEDFNINSSEHEMIPCRILK